MALESAGFISALNSANPAASDGLSQGDDHLRLIKACLLATFPNWTAVALASTQAQLDAAVTAANTTLPARFPVVTADIAAGAVTTAKIAAGAVVTASITNANITTALIAPANITTALIANANITTALIANSNITTALIADTNVTYGKIQNVAAAKLLGNPTGSAAAPSEITIGYGLSVSGSTLSAPLQTIPVLHVQEQQATNTGGGAFTSGAWRTRVLNTTLENDLGGSPLASNQITLPAGTYEIDARAPAAGVSNNQARLQNITDAATTLPGSSVFLSNANNVTGYSFVRGRFTIAGTKVFELQHQCGTTSANGFGSPGNVGLTEVYSDVILRKIA